MEIQGYSGRRSNFINREIEAAFSDIIHTPWSRGLQKISWQPSLDLYESDQAYVLRADLPGLEPESIHLEAKEHELTICGERQMSVGDKFGKLVIFERSTGRFCRTVSFDLAIDPQRVEFTYKNGIYEVVLPKKKH